MDRNGNSYVTGTFNNSNINFGNTTLYNMGNNDIFIVKFDINGDALWAKSSGWSGSDDGSSIAVDGSGNSYVIGSFNSSSIIFGSTTLITTGSSDLFIVKYNSAGTIVWAKSAGGSGGEIGEDIAMDDNGKGYVTGSFASSIVPFGSSTLSCAGSGNYGIGDIFIAKLGSSTVGVNENEVVENEIKIYPNPFNQRTTISFILEQKNATAKIMDVLGKEVKTINFTGKDLIIEKGEIQAGIYFIKIKTEQGTSTKKLIIQN